MGENLVGGSWSELERELGKLYRQVRPLNYEDLIKEDHMMGLPKVKAVRDSDGRIDILATFKKAGIDVSVMFKEEDRKW